MSYKQKYDMVNYLQKLEKGGGDYGNNTSSFEALRPLLSSAFLYLTWSASSKRSKLELKC